MGVKKFLNRKKSSKCSVEILVAVDFFCRKRLRKSRRVAVSMALASFQYLGT